MFEVFLYRIVLLMKKLIIWKCISSVVKMYWLQNVVKCISSAFQNVVKKFFCIYIYLIVMISTSSHSTFVRFILKNPQVWTLLMGVVYINVSILWGVIFKGKEHTIFSEEYLLAKHFQLLHGPHSEVAFPWYSEQHVLLMWMMAVVNLNKTRECVRVENPIDFILF